MKQLLIGTLIFITASIGYTRSPNSVYGMLGFRSGSAIFGAEFEHRMKPSHGISGYFLSAGKVEGQKVNLVGLTSIGATVKVHFGANRWDLYVAPGFGYHMMTFPGNTTDDQSALGPLLKLGSLYRFTRQLAFGLEYMKTFNWLNSDTGFGEFNFMNLTGKYTF